jgi:hypothetical protein
VRGGAPRARVERSQWLDTQFGAAARTRLPPEAAEADPVASRLACGHADEAREIGRQQDQQRRDFLARRKLPRELSPVRKPSADPRALRESADEQALVPGDLIDEDDPEAPGGLHGDPVDPAVFFAEQALREDLERTAERSESRAQRLPQSASVGLVVRGCTQAAGPAGASASSSSIAATSVRARAASVDGWLSAMGRCDTMDRERCTSSINTP